MSGEIAGVGIGVVMIAALVPVIVTLAAGAATVAATYFVGKGLVHVAGSLAEAYSEHKEKVKVQNCSRELDSTYDMLQRAIDAQAVLNTQVITDIGNRLQDEFDPQKISIDLDTPQLDRKVSMWRCSINQIMSESCEEVAAQCQSMLAQSRAEISSRLEEIESSKNALASWTAQDTARKANNQALVIEAMRDAKSSLQLLRSLAESYNSTALKMSYNSLVKSYNDAAEFANDRMYQSAFANAHTIIKSAAQVIADHSFGLLEADYYKAILTTKINGLKKEMKVRRKEPIRIRTPRNEERTLTDVDLAEFAQGKYESELKALENEIASINGMGDVTAAEILARIEEFDNETLPRVRSMLDRATQKYLGCQEKIHALEVITRFMNDQNYSLKWLQNPGSDLTQETVVKFARNETDTAVSVVIDTGDKATEATGMNISVHTFSDTGNDVPAAMQDNLRNGLNKALSEEGIGGTLSCDPATLGKTSHVTEYDDQKSVEMMPVRKVI